MRTTGYSPGSALHVNRLKEILINEKRSLVYFIDFSELRLAQDRLN